MHVFLVYGTFLFWERKREWDSFVLFGRHEEIKAKLKALEDSTQTPKIYWMGAVDEPPNVAFWGQRKCGYQFIVQIR